jgi:hypothetical protein
VDDKTETKQVKLKFDVRNRSRGDELAKDLFGPRGCVWKQADGLWAVGATLPTDGRVVKGTGPTLEVAFKRACDADPRALQNALDRLHAEKQRWANANPVLAARKLYLERRKKARNG